MKKRYKRAFIEEHIDLLGASIVDEWSTEKTLVILGIRRGGVPIAEALADALRPHFTSLDLGFVDVSFYRDDHDQRLPSADVASTDVAFDVNDRVIILVDDVIGSGRTVRAAMGHVMDLGRPRCIRLACLLDRGGRELPIAPDYAGPQVKVNADEKIIVKYSASEGNGRGDGVFIDSTQEANA